MEQKEKELVLKDICARLPYGTKVRAFIGEKGENDEILGCVHIFNFYAYKCKPYLRPMSSMTEEELKEYHKTFFYHERYDNEHKTGQNCSITFETYDWLNAHHFDYRGLIKKGLALEAPEGMYDEQL